MDVLIKENERLEDLDLKGLKIIQNPDYFCFGIDAVLLAWFAAKRLTSRARVVDLGTGTGVIPLLLYGRVGLRHIDALEIQENMVDLAQRNVRLNDLESVIHVHHADIRSPGEAFHSSFFDAVICNPPYMPLSRGMKSPSETLAISRHELMCTLEDVAEFARVMLKDNGKLFMIHRADRLSDVLNTLREKKIEPKRLMCVHPFADKPANLILIEGVKKGKSAMIIEPPLTVYRDDLTYTDAINAIYSTDAPTKRVIK